MAGNVCPLSMAGDVVKCCDSGCALYSPNGGCWLEQLIRLQAIDLAKKLKP